MTRIIKKIVSALLVFNLIYANLNMAIFGLISYATDGVQEDLSAQGEQEVLEEQTSENGIKIDISNFYKNNMKEEETKYSETITFNLSNETNFTEIVVNDIETGISEESVEEETENKVNVFYESSVINKTDLMAAIGEEGTLDINYTVLEENTETQNDETEVPEGTIVAENGTVQIDTDIVADEEENITVVYPENTTSINITVKTDTNSIKDLAIVNNKKIEKVENIETVDILTTTKNLSVKVWEAEILNLDETVETNIYYTKTYAELGVNPEQFSTSQENEVNFTITLHTESKAYDLYVNPEFILELPKEVKSLEIDKIELINNDDEYLKIDIDTTGAITTDNGNLAIQVNLLGEQLKITESELENMQIAIKATLKTEELIPTLDREVNLYYTNENVVSYDGAEKATAESQGINKAKISLVSNSEIIVETKATAGETVVSSIKEDYKEITVEPEINEVKIQGTAINNTNADIKTAVISGEAINVGEITVQSESKSTIYYFDSVNNTVSETYNPNAKKFLIIIEDFAQGEKVTFNYTITLPKGIKTDTAHEVKFDVYDNENNNNIKTSKITINQQPDIINEYKDEEIQVNIEFPYQNKFELNDRVGFIVNLTNLSDQKLENIDMKIKLPTGFTKVFMLAYRTIENGTEEPEYIFVPYYIEENTIIIEDLYLDAGETLPIPVSMDIAEFISSKQRMNVDINYDNKEINLTEVINIVEPSTIETTITSNKEGKTLKVDEIIEYIVTIENKGESSAQIDINMPKLEQLNIYSFKVKNVSTGYEFNLLGSNMTGGVDLIEIGAGEKLEINISGKVNPLETNDTVTMYLDISGRKIYNTSTNQISNFIKVIEDKPEVPDTPINPDNPNDPESPDNPENPEEPTNPDNPNDGDGTKPEEIPANNKISGIAWVDANENGIKDKNEVLLKGIQAILVNTVTKEKVSTTITDANGKYEFKNITSGTYIVEFKFNTTTFKVTEYQKGKNSQDIDSDAIITTQNNETIAKTAKIELINSTDKNINIGLVVNQKFDMSIQKGITKVTVNNKLGEKTYIFENSDMAKIEISEDYFKGSLVLVEYEISVKNTGEVSGYVKSISDIIPQGMKFNSELNPDWYEGNDGKLYSVSMQDKEIKPGETRTVKLVLTQEVDESKVISPINTAEIEETFNEYLIADKEDENNISDATVIIAIKTGGTATYMWLVLLVVTIIGSGLYGTIKILNKDVKSIK